MSERSTTSETRAALPSALEVHLLGLVDFDSAVALQERLVFDISGRDDQQGALLLCEHPPLITLGREANSSLVIDAEWVPRNHAMIEYKRGYFMLSDRSTNGTWAKLGEDDELRLHRDEIHLRKTGTISLGQAGAVNKEDVLTFQCTGV